LQHLFQGVIRPPVPASKNIALTTSTRNHTGWPGLIAREAPGDAARRPPAHTASNHRTVGKHAPPIEELLSMNRPVACLIAALIGVIAIAVVPTADARHHYLNIFFSYISARTKNAPKLMTAGTRRPSITRPASQGICGSDTWSPP